MPRKPRKPKQSEMGLPNRRMGQAAQQTGTPAAIPIQQQVQYKCGQPYRIDTQPMPPRNARIQLIYWDYVVFFSSVPPAVQYQERSLNYYQREDSRIETIKRTTVVPCGLRSRK